MAGRAPRSLALCFALVVTTRSLAGVDSTRAGWKDLSLLNARLAQTEFASVAASDPHQREARLGEALAVLQLPERTPATLARARASFEALQREQPDDDVGIAAEYYLARLCQVHAYVPDLGGAIARYRALIAGHPTHYYAQLAAPKLATLLLYDDVPDQEWERRVAEVQALLPKLTLPAARRDVRLALAMSLIRLRHDHARAYPLLAACLDEGSVSRLTHLNALLVQAAESAAQLGKPNEAFGWYARFVADFPNDPKTDEVRRRMNTLAASASGAVSAVTRRP